MNFSSLLPPYTPRVWKWLTIIAIAAIVTFSAIIYTRCTRDKPADPRKVQKAQKAIADGDRKQMEESLAELSADEAAADKIGQDAEAAKQFAIAEAKKKAESMSNQELADYLNGKAKE